MPWGVLGRTGEKGGFFTVFPAAQPRFDLPMEEVP